MDYQVRLLNGDDLIAANAVGREEAWLLEPAQGGGLRLLGDDRDPLFAYACVSNSGLVGWVYGAPRPSADYIAVDRLVVHPQHRRHGVGRRLVEQVLRDFKNVEVLMSGWKRDQRPFFEALGFREDADGNMAKLPPHLNA